MMDGKQLELCFNPGEDPDPPEPELTDSELDQMTDRIAKLMQKTPSTQKPESVKGTEG